MSDCLHCAHTQKVRLYKIDTQIRNWKKYKILVAVVSTHCNQTIHFHASLSLTHFNYTWCCWSFIECNRTHQLRTECKRILHLSAPETSDSAPHTQFQRTTTLCIRIDALLWQAKNTGGGRSLHFHRQFLIVVYAGRHRYPAIKPFALQQLPFPAAGCTIFGRLWRLI